MPTERAAPAETAAGQTPARSRMLTVTLALLPWMWLGFSVAWAGVMFVTDQVAWPLALWIATTVGPLTALKTRLERNTPDRKDHR